MPELPHVPAITLAPDWVCEVVSPSTESVDRSIKMAIYARREVSHVWLANPLAQTLELYRLDGETYRLLGTHAADSKVRAEPFEAIELDLSILWAR